MNKLRRFTQRVASVWDVPERDVAGMLTGARPSTVRVNRLHPCAPADWETEPVPWCADAYWCTDAAAAIPLAHEGKVYLQNASSLIPVVALDPRPGESIVDTAAAPGGLKMSGAPLGSSTKRSRVAGGSRVKLNDSSNAVKPLKPPNQATVSVRSTGSPVQSFSTRSRISRCRRRIFLATGCSIWPPPSVTVADEPRTTKG